MQKVDRVNMKIDTVQSLVHDVSNRSENGETLAVSLVAFVMAAVSLIVGVVLLAMIQMRRVLNRLESTK